jgi:hypothetical protein
MNTRSIACMDADKDDGGSKRDEVLIEVVGGQQYLTYSLSIPKTSGPEPQAPTYTHYYSASS